MSQLPSGGMCARPVDAAGRSSPSTTSRCRAGPSSNAVTTSLPMPRALRLIPSEDDDQHAEHEHGGHDEQGVPEEREQPDRLGDLRPTGVGEH